MPDKGFVSKPYKEFKNFHIELNKYIKISICSINYLSQSTEDKDELNGTISELIKNAGERWLSTKYAKPFDELDFVKSQLSKSAIMWVFSSFEVFLNLVHSTYSHAIQNHVRPERIEQIESIRLIELFEKFNWDLNEINYLLPVFDFYGLSRHSIVHNMGIASQDLISMRESDIFTNAIENWPTVIKGRRLSPAPEIDARKNINIGPHHAITYSDICYRISQVVNLNIFKTLGLDFFVIQLANDTILNKKELVKPYCIDVYAYISYQLKSKYNIDPVSPTDLRFIFEANGNRKKIVAKYGTLKKKVSNK